MNQLPPYVKVTGPYEESTDYQIVQTQMESGYIRMRRTASRPLIKVRVSFLIESYSHYEAFQEWYNDYANKLFGIVIPGSTPTRGVGQINSNIFVRFSEPLVWVKQAQHWSAEAALVYYQTDKMPATGAN